ncbi:MAG: hypothetical protein AAGD07_15320 [Planctomycetota bacterium]
MPNYGPPTELSAEQMRSTALLMREIAADFEQLADRTDEIDAEALWVFGSTTARTAIRQLRNFQRQIDESIDQYRIGTPFSADSRKSRNGVITPDPLAPKPSKMADDDARAAEIIASEEKRIQGIVARDQADQAKEDTKRVGKRAATKRSTRKRKAE